LRAPSWSAGSWENRFDRIEIINLALSDCGSALIATIDDDLPEARQAKAKYGANRDAVLEAREWTFAKRRLLLTQDAVAPSFGYTYQYILPSNVIRVVRLYSDSGSVTGDPTPVNDWVREGWRVLANDDVPIYAEVIVRVDEGDFSPGMVLTLCLRGSRRSFAIPLTENRQLAKDFMDFYKALIQEAGAMDGSQGTQSAVRPPPLPGRRQHF
jgi:hypothetical protein